MRERGRERAVDGSNAAHEVGGAVVLFLGLQAMAVQKRKRRGETKIKRDSQQKKREERGKMRGC